MLCSYCFEGCIYYIGLISSKIVTFIKIECSVTMSSGYCLTVHSFILITYFFQAFWYHRQAGRKWGCQAFQCTRLCWRRLQSHCFSSQRCSRPSPIRRLSQEFCSCYSCLSIRP